MEGGTEAGRKVYPIQLNVLNLFSKPVCCLTLNNFGWLTTMKHKRESIKYDKWSRPDGVKQGQSLPLAKSLGKESGLHCSSEQ